jgi:hypothetical protein
MHRVMRSVNDLSSLVRGQFALIASGSVDLQKILAQQQTRTTVRICVMAGAYVVIAFFMWHFRSSSTCFFIGMAFQAFFAGWVRCTALDGT